MTRPFRCYYRQLLLATTGIVLSASFWFASRYPQLLEKAAHVGSAVPSMAFSSEVIRATAHDAIWLRILASTVNWLASMRLGMSFGVLLGALLHTTLTYYPLKIGKNTYLNSLRGALVGIPAGVCANCAVPTACGITRGEGRVEVALGFLFSSPNFNPVVVAMTFTALPLSMAITKYVVIALVIAVGVPWLIRWLEKDKSIQTLVPDDFGAACEIARAPDAECDESLPTVFRELTVEFGKNVWMLVKPTVTVMLIAALAAGILLTVVPWGELLSHVTVGRALLLSFVSTLMPVPIALDVMFAGQLHAEGAASGYVMMFASTLGSFSIIPAVYLWREVSKRLAVVLFAFFVVVGFVSALVF
jgi:uncharacterized membrane protein YraQ (UPF0718 family)